MDPAGLRARGRVLEALRGWFAAHRYVEVPTPALVAAGAVEEHLHAVSAGGRWLRTSPELALKRVLAAGLHRIYEIGPCFRDRERGPWHGREFHMVEWYRAGAELVDLMREVEDLVAVAAEALGQAPPGPWRRVSVRQLFLEVTGIDLARASAGDLGQADEPWDDAFFRCWVDAIEPTLTTPVFVEDWPASQAALAQIRTDGSWPVACRFEVFVGGVELANAFLELTDAQEQRRRWLAANAARATAGVAPHPVDPAFLAAVARLPRSAGIALGLDRLVAALLGWDGIGAGRIDSG